MPSSRRRLNDHRVDDAVRIHPAVERRLFRRDDELVEREAERAALLLHHADDGVRNALDAQLAPDRIEVREEVIGDVLADHDDRRAERVFLRGDEPALRSRPSS